MTGDPQVTSPAIGAAGEVVHQVGESDTARSIGSGEVAALATPRLIAWLEEATCRALDGRLSGTETSVGTAVSISHLRASPIGAVIACRAEVVEVDGRRVRLAVHAEQDGQVVARGEVTRAVVDLAGFEARLAAG